MHANLFIFKFCKTLEVLFMNLTAAYDIVWRRGIVYKILKITKSRNIVKAWKWSFCAFDYFVWFLQRVALCWRLNLSCIFSGFVFTFHSFKVTSIECAEFGNQLIVAIFFSFPFLFLALIVSISTFHFSLSFIFKIPSVLSFRLLVFVLDVVLHSFGFDKAIRI